MSSAAHAAYLFKVLWPGQKDVDLCAKGCRKEAFQAIFNFDLIKILMPLAEGTAI